MTRELKNIEASIKRRLYNVAKKERLNFDFILLLFMQERLLYRLSISKYNRKFILKGGLLILSTTNFKTRPTRDIDFLAQNINNYIHSTEGLGLLVQINTWIPAEVYTHESGCRNDIGPFVCKLFKPSLGMPLKRM